MQKFNKKDADELKKVLYNSNVHDAKFKKIEYKHGEDLIKMELFNPIFNVAINIIFHNIGTVLAIKEGVYGDCETISSLTVEDDFSYLQNHMPKYNGSKEDCIYLLFQMFSGDELHIVSKEVIIEIIG